MKMQTAIATLGSGVVMTLAATGFAQASTPTYLSGTGTTAVTATSQAALTGLGVGQSNADALTGPVPSVNTGAGVAEPGSYGQLTAPYNGAAWVTGFVNNGAYASGVNDSFYTFTQTLDTTTTPQPFSVNGTLLSDNALVGIYVTAGATTQYYGFDTTNYMNASAYGLPGGSNSYKIALNFGPYVGSGSPDSINFVIFNENQASDPAPITTQNNPVAIDYGFTVSPAAVPEPTSVASFGLGGFGLLGLMLRARKARRTVA